MSRESFSEMAGLYIHIPFCKQACIYCAFHFSTVLKNKERLVEAICEEMELRKDYLGEDSTLQTVYFGGGTPSILSLSEIRRIKEKAESLFSIAAGAEITLEANPDDLTLDKLKGLKDLGINRLSIGIQSFYEAHLKWMNRAHNAQEAISCVEHAYAAGFDNFSIDLIFGFPGLSDEQWENNLDRAFSFGVPHLSCYALTREPKTVLDAYIKKGKVPPINDDAAARQYEILLDKLDEKGYEAYEISNFCKPGMRAKHNSNYWKRIPYLGVGPGAHSFRPGERQWNVSNNAAYSKAIEKGEIPCKKEQLTELMQWDEYIMTSLRTMEGCDLEYLTKTFGEEKVGLLLENSKPFIEKKRLKKEGGHLAVTREGRLFADGIAAALFLD